MEKDKLKILDGSFSHSILGYCSDYQVSNIFEWDRKITDLDNTVVITDSYLTQSNLPFNKKIAWLIEPKCININNYSFIYSNNKMFDYVLTHEKELLDKGENFKFVPFGCCWIPEKEQKIYDKTNNISIIASNKKQTDGHRLRHDVISKFKDNLDVYGNGYQKINSKLEGLKNYRFSIVIENCSRDYWFTEKLIDCFMTGTIPIYWGCPSIGDFFDTDGMLIFKSIDELDDIIKNCNEDLYMSKIKNIENNFNLGKNYLLPDNFVYNFIKNLNNE